MTKDEQIAKLREALEECASDLEAEVEARFNAVKRHAGMERQYKRDMATVEKARATLAASSEPPQPGEIEIAAAVLVDKFNRAQWSLNDDWDGLDDEGCAILRELVVAALQAALGAKP